jgi:hypothetical protein
MRLAVVGSRSFSSYQTLEWNLNPYLNTCLHLVSGGAEGADSLAQEYAKRKGLGITVYYPAWQQGMSAGFICNQKIIDDCDMMIAFWDGESKGTEHSIKTMELTGKGLIVITKDLWL